MPEIFSPGPIPEHLPGEPRRQRASTPVLLLHILLRALSVAILSIVGLFLGPLYLLAVAIWGWPPNVPRLAQVRRYLGLAVSERPPPPGLPMLVRIWIILAILRKCALAPITGLAWLLDELLYGRALREVEVRAPLIEISAGRSGSTQLARYLEDDPQLAAPSLLQSLFPYLWLWRLAPRTLGKIISRDRVRSILESMMSPEFLQRHEADPFRTDTFDGALYISHLNHLAMSLGPDVGVDDFGFASTAPHNRRLWDEDFVALLDGVARRTLVHAGPGPSGARRFFVKGHFLAAASALEARYPDARFLTMLREPAPRLRSAVNYIRVNPTDPALGPPPWAWLSEAIVRTEVDYCEMEKAWFSREGGARRCVLRFSAYKRDLEGTMAKVYRECLDTPTLPPHVPREHAPRKRTDYLIDRSLEDLRIDEEALNARLAGYIAWCREGAPTSAATRG